MARQDKKSYDLSEAEQRDLVTLIQQGKALPEKYRFVLFEDKREVELVWNGKTRDVCTTVLPFQTLEHIDEPRVETKAQEDLFDSRGRQQRGWTNKLIWGDNKLILSSLKAGALRLRVQRESSMPAASRGLTGTRGFSVCGRRPKRSDRSDDFVSRLRNVERWKEENTISGVQRGAERTRFREVLPLRGLDEFILELTRK